MRNASERYLWNLGLILLLVPICTAQEKIRTVENGRSYPNQPVVVVSRELGDKPFENDTQVLGDQDWLRHLRLGIKNVSNKNITAFDIELVIEKQGKPLMSMPIYFRNYTMPTPEQCRDPARREKTGNLLPGEVVRVKVNDHVMSAFGDWLKKYDAENVDRVRIDIRVVYYDNKTHWAFGKEYPNK